MFKYLVLFSFLVPLFFISASAPQHCGNGDRQYRMDPNKKEVIYYANIGEFTLRREAANKVRVTDSVRCRYGEDLLIDLDRVVFLDKIVSVSELAVQAKITTLSVDTLKALLFEKLFAQILAKGVNPNNPQLPDKEAGNSEVAATTNTSTQTGSTVYIPAATVGLSTDSSYYSAAASVNSSQSVPTTVNSNSAGSYQNYVPAYGPYGPYNANPYAPVGQPVYSPMMPGYFPVNNYQAAANTRPTTQANNQAVVPISWDTKSLDPQAIVYFEATDASNAHHYLGSAIASQGSDSVMVSKSFFTKGKVTISVKTGNRVLNSFDVQLQ